MGFLIFVFAIIGLLDGVRANITYTHIPRQLQLYARDLETDSAGEYASPFIRVFGFGHSRGRLQIWKEAQRRLALELEDVFIMSTSGVDHRDDNCHYTFQGGYELIGQHAYGLMAQEFYGDSLPGAEPPQVTAAWHTEGDKITLQLKNHEEVYTWEPGAEADFQLKGTNVHVLSGSVEGCTILLQLSGAVSGITAISYVGHQQSAAPMVRSESGVGAVHFRDLPVQKGVPTSLVEAPELGRSNHGGIGQGELTPPLKRIKGQIGFSRFSSIPGEGKVYWNSQGKRIP